MSISVLFDATAFHPRGKGLSRYIWNLLYQMLYLDNSTHYEVLYNKNTSFEGMPDSRNVRFTPVAYPSFLTWKLFHLPRYSASGAFDIVHCPDQLLPRHIDCATVITVHELYKLRNRIEALSNRYFRRDGIIRSAYECLFRSTLANASHMIAVSNSTKRDLLAEYGLKPEDVTVVHEAADHKGADEVGKENIVLPEGKYIVAFATGDSRENPECLASAFGELKTKKIELPLVAFIGTNEHCRSRLENLGRKCGVQDKLCFYGFLTDAQLTYLLSGAILFVELSKYEGFGLQVLEAMSLGIPVIASRLNSLPEVVGNAGILIDSSNAREVSQAILQFLEDENYRLRMAQLGKERSRHFSWRRAAEETILVYHKLLSKMRQ